MADLPLPYLFAGAAALAVTLIVLTRSLAGWYFRLNNILRGLEAIHQAQLATAAELRALRADIAALNNQPPPS
jgi:hypothetical protein